MISYIIRNLQKQNFVLKEVGVNMQNSKSAFHAKMAVLTTCIMLFTWVGLCWNCLSLYADPIISEWGIMRTQFMVIFTIMSMANAVMNMFFYGKLQDRFGARKLILIGGPVATIGFLLIALSQNLPLFYIGGFLFGISVCGLNNNPVTVIISEWYRKNVGKMVGIPQTVSSVSGIIFSIVFAAIIRNLGWRIPMWITVAVSGLSVLIISIIYKGSPEEVGEKPMYADEVEDVAVEEEDGIVFKSVFKTPQFYFLAVGYLLFPTVAMGVLSNLPLLAGDFGFAELSGTINAAALVASAAFFIPGGAIIDKKGTKWMVVLCCSVLVAALMLLRFASPNLIMMFLIAVFIGVGYDVCTIAFGISVREAFGSKEYGSKLGIISAFVYIGLAFGPSVMTLFYDAAGSYNAAFVVFAILAVVGTVCIFFGTKRVENQTNV